MDGGESGTIRIILGPLTLLATQRPGAVTSPWQVNIKCQGAIRSCWSLAPGGTHWLVKGRIHLPKGAGAICEKTDQEQQELETPRLLHTEPWDIRNVTVSTQQERDMPRLPASLPVKAVLEYFRMASGNLTMQGTLLLLVLTGAAAHGARMCMSMYTHIKLRCDRREASLGQAGHASWRALVPSRLR